MGSAPGSGADKFKFEQNKEESTAHIVIEGDIGENSVFKSVDLSGCTKVHLETEKIRYFNSAGVANWVSWMKSMVKSNPKTEMVLDRVPYAMTKHVSMVINFIPKGAKITSFIVPYCCSKCMADQDLTFIVNAEFCARSSTDSLRKTLEQVEVPCAKCGARVNLDANFDCFANAISKHG